MKQSTIMQAYKALLQLSGQELPIREAWAVAKLMDKLRPFWDFQAAEEQKFLAGHAWRPDGESIHFEKPEDAEAFGQRIREIAELEQDIEVKPFKLRLTDDIKLTAQDIRALDGLFVEFTEG